MRQVLMALRLKDVGVMRLRLVKDAPQGMDLGEVGDGCAGVGKGKPEAILGAEARVAVDHQA